MPTSKYSYNYPGINFFRNSSNLEKELDYFKRDFKNDKFYNIKNLSFLTIENNGSRAPTLYFESKNKCGRMRQEHIQGPNVWAPRNQYHIFFKKKNDLEFFCKECNYTSFESIKRFLASNFDEENISFKPQSKWFHFNISNIPTKGLLYPHKSSGMVFEKKDFNNENSYIMFYPNRNKHTVNNENIYLLIKHILEISAINKKQNKIYESKSITEDAIFYKHLKHKYDVGIHKQSSKKYFSLSDKYRKK
jgi:hypothetical protein